MFFTLSVFMLLVLLPPIVLPLHLPDLSSYEVAKERVT
jgi:hypothetical protein